MALINDPRERVLPQFLAFLLRVVRRKVAPARIARGLLLCQSLRPCFQEQVVFVDIYFHWNRLEVQIGSKRQVNSCAELLIEGIQDLVLQGVQVLLLKLCYSCLREEVGCELLHLDLLLRNLERKEEMVDDRETCSTLHGDMSLRS